MGACAEWARRRKAPLFGRRAGALLRDWGISHMLPMLACIRNADGGVISWENFCNRGGASAMAIIDSQVHAYEANTPKRPWHSVPNWPDHVTGDEMVAAMDKVGVDGAIFISAFSMYRYDASYAVAVQRTHPGRFAIVKPVDPDDPAVADVVADWKKTPGTVGIRIMLTEEAKRDPNDPGLDRILRAAVRHDFPVNILCWGNLDVGTALIARHPDTRFIIDHLGIMQPRRPPAPAQPWADL